MYLLILKSEIYLFSVLFYILAVHKKQPEDKICENSGWTYKKLSKIIKSIK